MREGGRSPSDYWFENAQWLAMGGFLADEQVLGPLFKPLR